MPATAPPLGQGQVRPMVRGPIQRQQVPRPRNPPANNATWTHTPAQQPQARPFGSTVIPHCQCS